MTKIIFETFLIFIHPYAHFGYFVFTTKRMDIGVRLFAKELRLLNVKLLYALVMTKISHILKDDNYQYTSMHCIILPYFSSF